MNRIQVNAKFANISSSNLAEFKKVAAHALEIAKSEPGVLQYDWFFDDTQTVCVVRETYQDSEALLAHITRTCKGPPRGTERGHREEPTMRALPASPDRWVGGPAVPV